MDNLTFLTKGNRDDILSRIGQVHTITIYCPLEDFYVRLLKDIFEDVLPKYKVKDNLWVEIPSIDALNAFVAAATLHKKLDLEIDTSVLGIIVSSLQMFPKLKLISFQFTDDDELMNTYKLLSNHESKGIKKNIYNVDMLEMNLGDMFSQKVIDMLNKVFICNELIPNSYLKRRFVMDFEYDEYISFMDMFLGNNKENLNLLDKNICDYFRKFPKKVEEQKPRIRIITNYSEM